MPTMTEEENGRWTIDKRTVPIKLFYFLFLAGSGSLLPFLPVYMKQLGLTSSEVGVIYGQLPFVCFILNPIFGGFADRYQRHKLFLLVASVLSAIFIGVVVLIPAKPLLPIHSDFLLHRETIPSSANQTLVIFPAHDIVCVEDTNNSCISVMPITCVHGHLDVETNIFNHNNSQITKDSRCHFEDPRNKSSANYTMCSTITEGIKSKMSIVKFRMENHNLLIPIEKCELDHIHCDEEYVTYERYYGCVNAIDLRNSHNYNLVTDEYGLTFWLFIVAFSFGYVFFTQVNTQVDTITYGLLEDDPSQWGNQRLFGSLGYGVSTLLATIIMNLHRGPHGEVSYSIFFYIFVITCSLSSIVAYFIPITIKLSSTTVLKDTAKLFMDLKILAFFVICFFYGLYNGGVVSFLFWFLSDLQSHHKYSSAALNHTHRQSQPLILGLCTIINCLSEALTLRVSGKIINKFGHLVCMYIVGVAFFVPYITYSFMTNAWIALAVEPFIGLTYGLFISTASSYASVVAPEDLQATSQGCLNGIFNGLGRGLGGFLTGFLFQYIGDRWTFFSYACSSLIVVALYASLQCCVFKASHRPNKDPERTPILK